MAFMKGLYLFVCIFDVYNLNLEGIILQKTDGFSTSIGKEGPIHDVQWSNSGSEFAVVYGCILWIWNLC